MIEQLSIYTENKKGATREILSNLSNAGINVLGFVNNDSAEFGTIRLVLSDTAAAEKTLTEKGYLCRSSHVIGVELDDQPGALENLLAIFEDMNINIDYMYVGYRRENETPIIMIHSSDMEIVSGSLKNSGYSVY